MNRLSLIVPDPPGLSDENAARCLDFLQELTTAFENYYAHQLRRYYEPAKPDHPDLFEDLRDDQLPF